MMATHARNDHDEQFLLPMYKSIIFEGSSQYWPSYYEGTNERRAAWRLESGGLRLTQELNDARVDFLGLRHGGDMVGAGHNRAFELRHTLLGQP